VIILATLCPIPINLLGSNNSQAVAGHPNTIIHTQNLQNKSPLLALYPNIFISEIKIVARHPISVISQLAETMAAKTIGRNGESRGRKIDIGSIDHPHISPCG
jgi:hypothetical protein